MSKDPITMTAEMVRDAWIIMGIRTAGLMGITTLPVHEIPLMISEKQDAMCRSAGAFLGEMCAPSAHGLANVLAPFHEATSKNVVRLLAHATQGKTV